VDSPFRKLLLEESAHHFAMAFAEWCVENNVKQFDDEPVYGNFYKIGGSGNVYDMYRLLQNFKIEKEL
jgi:hypothetical protein